MPPVTDTGIILQVIAYGETSKILRILTSGHGVASVIAKGARRPRSRYGGLLEPFTEGAVTMYVKENRELQTLSAFELIRSRQQLGADLVRFGGATVFSEIILRTASAHPDPSLFERVRAGLDRIAASAGEQLEAILLSELWALVSHLGFTPELDRCQQCDRELDPTAEAVFDYAGGGIRCVGCPGLRLGRRIPAEARSALRHLTCGEPPSLERTRAHWTLFDKFVSYHILDGRELQAFAFLASALQDG